MSQCAYMVPHKSEVPFSSSILDRLILRGRPRNDIAARLVRCMTPAGKPLKLPGSPWPIPVPVAKSRWDGMHEGGLDQACNMMNEYSTLSGLGGCGLPCVVKIKTRNYAQHVLAGRKWSKGRLLGVWLHSKSIVRSWRDAWPGR